MPLCHEPGTRVSLCPCGQCSEGAATWGWHWEPGAGSEGQSGAEVPSLQDAVLPLPLCPQNSQLSCLGWEARPLLFRPAGVENLQLRCSWIPLKQISLLTKIKRTQSTPVFAVGVPFLLSHKKLDPEFPTGTGPRASKGKFQSGQGPWRGALENGSAPRGGRGPEMSKPRVSLAPNTFCLIFLGTMSAFSWAARWDVSAERMLLASSAAEPAFSELGQLGETEVPPMGRAPGRGGPHGPRVRWEPAGLPHL